MKWKSAILLLLGAAWLLGCGPRRIEKLPVPAEHIIQAFRLMAEADQLLIEGKDHLALLKYIEASTLHPYHEVIFNKLAINYSRLHQFEQARRAVDRSIGLNPQYAYAYNTLGIIHLATERPGDAVKAFARSIRYQPDAASFHVNLGYAHIQRGRYERGLESYRRALELDPEIFQRTETIQLTYASDSAISPEKQYQLARVFAALGDRRSCLHYLRRAFSAGFTDLRRMRDEHYFEELWEDPEFILLLSNYGLTPGNL